MSTLTDAVGDDDLRLLLLRIRDGQIVPADPLKVSATMLKRRRKVFCFLYYVEFGGAGWCSKKIAVGSVIQQLGYPTFQQLKEWSDEIEDEEPQLTSAYRWAFKEYREVQRRLAATETITAWDEYKTEARLYTIFERKWAKPIFSRLIVKYRSWQLFPRRYEADRARSEIGRALEKIQALRRMLFERYDVPENFRHLA